MVNNSAKMRSLEKMIAESKRLEDAMKINRLAMMDLLKVLQDEEVKDHGYYDDGIWAFSGGV